MKKLSLFALAAVGLLFGACADKDVVTEEPQFNQYDLIEGQSAWVSLGIALPGDAMVTRSNEDLHDGEAAEYAVYSAKLVLFKGATEDEATLIKDYSIATEWELEKGDNAPGENQYSAEDGDVSVEGKKYGEVTSTSKKVVKEIESPSLGTQDKLYGYVILNCDNNLTGISYTPGMKFTDFKEQVLKAIGIKDETKGFGDINNYGLVMTNVPISSVAGGSSEPTGAIITTLAEIDKDAVYKSEDEAKAGTATACIYVERAAVKVEVEMNSSLDKIELPYGSTDKYTAVTPAGTENPSTEGWYEQNGTAYELSTDATVDAGKTYYTKTTENVTYLDFAFEGWALGNVNYGGESGTGYYNTRQFDNKWLPYNNNQASDYLKYRMVGRTNFFTNGHTTAYRTYFGRDVNYTNELFDPTKLTYTDDADPSNPVEVKNYAPTNLLNKQLTTDQYTLADKGHTFTYENTFDENSQIWANTTYVGIKLKIGDADFYTIEGQPNTKLELSDLPSEVTKNHSADISAKNTAIKAAIEANLTKTTLADGDLNYEKDASTQIKEISYDLVPEVVMGTREDDGSMPYTFTLTLTNVKNKVGNATTFTDMPAADITTLNTLVNAILTAPVTGTTKIYKYVGGYVYYSARISHFGDVETPWSAPEMAYNNYSLIYPTTGKSSHTTAPVTYSDSRASAWLGRWGIVRNNWYKISIDEIKGLGSPVPEDYSGIIGGTPDDNPETKYYISAHVHILPWAVRNQSVKF
jgi:hypothetical protein